MPHRFCLLLSITILVSIFFFAHRANAQDTRGVDEPSGLYGEGFAGVRTISVDNIGLKPAAAGDLPSRMHVDARAVSPGFAGVFGGGGGYAIGPLVLGVDLGLGIGGGARGPLRPAGDIDVKPSGFVAFIWADAYVGLKLEGRRARYRLDAVLGEELAGLGMERPGYPDTRVTAVNGTRWTFGPRARVDFLRTEIGSLGVALGSDVRSPMNATLMFVVTSM